MFSIPFSQVIQEMLRDAEIMREDAVSRIAAAAFGALLGLYFIDHQIVVACIVAYILAELLYLWLMRLFDKRPTRLLYAALTFATFAGAVAFITPAYFLWTGASLGAKFVAVCMVFGSLFHVALIRAAHLPTAVVTVAPAIVVLLSFPFEILAEQDAAAFVISIATVLVLITYVFLALLGSYRTKMALISASARAERANRTKSQFLASVSHEIRTPLNGILGVAQALRDESGNEAASPRVDLVLNSARSLQLIVDDLLDLSKIEAGRMDIRRQSARLIDAVEVTVELHRPRAEEKDLHLSYRVADEAPAIASFDPLRVRQCLGNLISNAIKFTNEGSVVVTVDAQPQSDGSHKITARVADTGIGVPEEKVSHLFSRFYQVADPNAPGSGGTGLGLSITKQLATLMGGDAGMEPVDGGGSVFWFSFEAAAVEANIEDEAIARRGAGATSPAPLRVLVADDTPTNRFVARLFLEAEGHAVAEAENGREVLDALAAADDAASSGFDVVLMDVRMPVMDGMDALREIRSADRPWRDVPVVAMTADAMCDKREAYLSAGMSGYVTKPVDKNQLLDEIARVTSAALDEAMAREGDRPAA